MLLYFPVQAVLTRVLTSFRQKANLNADKRVKIIQQVIAGIRVIKIYAWEKSFKLLLSSVRATELGFVLKYLFVRAAISAITQVIPTFAMIFSFMAYSLLGNPLLPSVIFSSLALFYSLRVPLLVMPMALTQVIFT